jgi:hypothetical protein
VIALPTVARVDPADRGRPLADVEHAAGERQDQHALFRDGLQRVVAVPELARHDQQVPCAVNLATLASEQHEDGDKCADRHDRDDRAHRAPRLEQLAVHRRSPDQGSALSSDSRSS